MFTIYSADTAGIPSNCLYPHIHRVTDDSSLKAAVLTDYVCAEYKTVIAATATSSAAIACLWTVITTIQKIRKTG